MARPDRAQVLRDELDRRLGVWRRADLDDPPVEGWARSIRTALGMSTREMADRLGVAQPRIPVLERSEADRTVRLDTLERAAGALGCRFVYALVPDRPLEEMVSAPRRLTDADTAEIKRHAASTGRGITASELLALVRDMTGTTASAGQDDLGAEPAEP